MGAELAPFDPAEALTTPGHVLAYLEAAFEEGDPAMIAVALGNAARAEGMTAIAEATGQSRPAPAADRSAAGANAK